MSIFIYALKEKDADEIRYIGQTINCDSRYRNHLRDTKLGKEKNKNKAEWISDVFERGLSIEMVVIEKCSCVIASSRETYWMNYYKGLGHRLTNATQAGSGKLSKSITYIQEIDGFSIGSNVIHLPTGLIGSISAIEKIIFRGGETNHYFVIAEDPKQYHRNMNQFEMTGEKP